MGAELVIGRYNRRSADFAAVPAPMRVSDAAIALCRAGVEGRWKRWVRAALLPAIAWRLGLRSAGEGFQWGRGTELRGARVGRFVAVGPRSRLNGPVSIGDLTMISADVTLAGDDHEAFDAARIMRVAFPRAPRPVTVIEADCWIGQGAILKEGIRIGRGSVVGAGAVVTGDVAPYSVAAGVPARCIRRRFSDGEVRGYEAMVYRGVADDA